MSWSVDGCARDYEKLTGRDAADDARFPYLEGVFIWRFVRARHDFVSLLRTTLKEGRALRGRDKKRDELWYARFRRARAAFEAHAALHDGYGQLRILDQPIPEDRCREVLAQAEGARSPNAMNAPAALFVLGAKARWMLKGWGTPTPMQLALLAGATDFEPYTRNEVTLERWKARLRNTPKVGAEHPLMNRAFEDEALDGTGCFRIEPLPPLKAIPMPRLSGLYGADHYAAE